MTDIEFLIEERYKSLKKDLINKLFQKTGESDLEKMIVTLADLLEGKDGAISEEWEALQDKIESDGRTLSNLSDLSHILDQLEDKPLLELIQAKKDLTNSVKDS